ncbi:hypothetical protein SARC_09044 [Sphaeroforma arctica JP610]|uniref:Uncharacterized protein n=1 Tax=Sphaeroforma arctica JP610 TaxID=667725 RepID=A0A0L0FNW9_9EUKA|nr:hypothetical protein SARC_09044 [Sphaeroforma arctica JP610]KNC78530.1 hypothetical protein SARC_09044 [Sphaeroforma arctica JP610]|eukprot:XP_014152432.1 hypothetical protein SARC_09044 [Sphaeroforma arctica JP610]
MHGPIASKSLGTSMFDNPLKQSLSEVKDASIYKGYDHSFAYNGETIKIKNDTSKCTKPRISFGFQSYEDHECHDMYSHDEYLRGERRLRLTENEKDTIRSELIHYKLYEMDIHEDSRNNFNLHNKTNVMRHVASRLCRQNMERQEALQQEREEALHAHVVQPISPVIVESKKQNATSRWLFDVLLQTTKYKSTA